MRDSRVTSNHLARDAYLYIRQSTPRQVSENGESTRRQYALRERAVAAGWPAERIHVIDQDLGMSGAYSAGRDGFQQLVAAVGGLSPAWYGAQQSARPPSPIRCRVDDTAWKR